jgi:hypothetical protein
MSTYDQEQLPVEDLLAVVALQPTEALCASCRLTYNASLPVCPDCPDKDHEPYSEANKRLRLGEQP